MGEWISVNDRLPELGKYISKIVIATDGNFVGPMVYREIYKNGKTIYKFDYIKNILYSCGDIKYWMPLPEPPKEV